MKGHALDETALREYRRLAALVERQSGIRLNVERVVEARDEETLRVWERTLQTKGDNTTGLRRGKA